MIHGRYIGQGEDISSALIIREQIFADDFPEFDLHEENDPMALNSLIDLDGELIGVGRLVLDIIEDRFYVDDIGVLKEYRKNGYGDFIIRMLADKADQCGAKELWAIVPDFAKSFFKNKFFREEGMVEENYLMKADIASFKSCCNSSQCAKADESGNCNLGGCGACCN